MLPMEGRIKTRHDSQISLQMQLCGQNKMHCPGFLSIIQIPLRKILKAEHATCDLIGQLGVVLANFVQQRLSGIATQQAEDLCHRPGAADVAQAETQWLSARAQAVDVEINRAQLEHAIAVLTGHAPAEFSLAVVPMSEPGQLALAVPAVPGELPSGLLERRPDVAAAERRAAAANASIGVARAALFPTLTLSATGGYKGASASNLFDVAHRFWTLGPALALTVFDAGARRAQVDQAEAAYDAAAGTYRQTVLGALQDVEDALVALRVLDGEAQLQAQTVRAAGVSLQLALNQYRAGTIGYLNVVSAQTTDQNARLSALSIRGRQLSATVQLIKALGGGWSVPPEMAPAR